MNLHAGPIELTYENGFLRTFSINGDEVLRRIYVAFRDRNWNTARIDITDESVRSEAGSFVVDYNWQVDDFGIQMIGNVRIEGQRDGSITFDFYGKAINTFWRNRIGLCVLHPIEGLAGQPCVIENPDGQATEFLFPDLISPHQPFLNVQAMSWTMASGQRFRVAFDGDVFEVEDQRNWTDASYKTYSTPLERPFPVEIRPGTEVRQRVTFQPVVAESSPLPRSVSSQTGEQPVEISSIRIGLGHRPDGPPLLQSEADLLKVLDLSHLRADVYLSDADWQDGLLAALYDANQLNIPLELALFFSEDASAEGQPFIRFAKNHNVPVYSLLLFRVDTLTTTDALLNQVVPMFRAQMPGVLLGGGTDGNFADLNRNRFDFGQVNFVTYSINPQVHAFDDQTLMENVAGQADTVRSARVLSGGKPVHISPVTLLPRPNPIVESASKIVRPTPPVDPRLLTEFGAKWTRQSLQTLIRAGVASVTYYETHGPCGLVSGGKAHPVMAALKQTR